MCLGLGGRWRLKRWVCASALAAFVAAAQAQGVTVVDDLRVEHRFTAPPKRIVTLLPSLTEAVWLLGSGDKLVAVDRHSNWPKDLANLPRMGGMDDPLVEALLRLKPDVILASTATRGLDRLSHWGVPVVRLKSDTYRDIESGLKVVSALLGQPEKGPDLWQQIQKEIRAAAAQVPPALRGQTVYFELGAGPYAAGPSSFIGETLTALGLRNVVPTELGVFPKLSPEFLVRVQPEIVLGLASDAQRMSKRPGWSALHALSRGQVCGFDPADYDILVRSGPRLAEGARLIAKCLVSLDDEKK